MARRKSKSKSKSKASQKEQQSKEIHSETKPDDKHEHEHEHEHEITSEELQQAVQLASQALANVFGWNKPSSSPSQSQSQPQLSLQSTSNTNIDTNTNINTNTQSSSLQNKNPLSDLIPGYIAPMKLDSSELDPFKSNLSSMLTLTSTSKNKNNINIGIIQENKQTNNHQEELTKATTYTTDKPKHNHSHSHSANNTNINNAGPKWFNMQSTPMSDDQLKADLRMLANRNYLDPKKFYKSADKKSEKTRVVQLGTVVEGTGEFYSNRISNKHRKMNLTEELMHDSSITNYTKKSFLKINSTQQQKGRKFHKKKQTYKYK